MKRALAAAVLTCAIATWAQQQPALEELIQRAEQGTADAEAVKWYRLAAEQGHAVAQNHLGVMYREGQGVPRDDAEAAKWGVRGSSGTASRLACGPVWSRLVVVTSTRES